MRGTYQEEIIRPTEIRFREGKMMILTEDGEMYTSESDSVKYKLYKLYQNVVDKKPGEIRDMHPGNRTRTLNTNSDERKIKLILGDGGIKNIFSERHKQIPYTEIKEVTDGIVDDIFGDVDTVRDTERIWSYEVADLDLVAGFIGVDAGRNAAMSGKAAVTMYSRFQTRVSMSGSQPCLNWAQIWNIPTEFFNIDITRVHNVVTLLGEENVENLSVKKIHTTGTAIDEEGLREALEGFQSSLDSVEPVINQSVETEITYSEMENIMEAYQLQVDFPEYLTEQIMDRVKGESVWAFSNAISYVRTHGDFKTRGDTDSYNCDRAWQAERISGEILSLAPTIKEIKDKAGEITVGKLLHPEDTEELEKLAANS